MNRLTKFDRPHVPTTHHTHSAFVQGIEEAARMLVSEIVKRDAARPAVVANVVNPERPAAVKGGCC